MSDVTVAPAGGSAPPAAPNEVPIADNQVQTPIPLGQQAPDKPAAETRPPTRREAIQKAFDRANNPPSKDKPAPRQAAKPAEAAEAKPGHNNPPEETEKFDLKKRPAAEERPRSERGQFAPVNRREDRLSAGLQNSEAPEQQQPQRGGAPDPYREPPPRMKDHAKAEWAKAPESVRGEVHRMNQEFEGAYRQYRADFEAMNPIRHFHQMAIQHGTTLEKALTNYVSMEQKLREDVVGGLDVLVSNLGLKAADGRRLGLRDVAYHILNQSPEQHRLTQQTNQQQAASNQIGQLHQELAGLKSTLQQMHTAQQFTYTRSQVDQFADTHPRFDELGDLIHDELQLGFDLEKAYSRAELLRPSTQAPQTRTQSAQTRPIDRSISGAPAGPSNGTGRRPDKQVGRREAIQNAIRRQGAL